MNTTMETLLYQTLSSDDYERKLATNLLKRQELENYSIFIHEICRILLNEDSKDNIRMSAGLLLKNSLQNTILSLNWILMDRHFKNEIKATILSLLATEKRNVANIISQVIASLASIELPLGEWNDLVFILTNIITQKCYKSNMKRTTLQTIGYICESLDPNSLSIQQKNTILTAIIDAARREQLDVNVKLAAIQALYNSLKFIKANFENNVERDFIMKVICDAATQHINSTIELQVSAFECLNCIMQLYYDKMDSYMSSSLFNLLLSGMNRISDPSIMLQAIEFWSTVCHIELQIKYKNTNQTLYSFADQFVIYILPYLLNALVKSRDEFEKEEQEEEDDDEWNIVNSSAYCLSQFALLCKELVVPQTIQFIENKLLIHHDLILSNEIEAAIIAFGCILKGPCKYKTQLLVEQMLPIVLNNTRHDSYYIRIASTWTLSRIIKESIHILDPQVITEIIPVIIDSLRDPNKKVVKNTCLSIVHLAEELKTKNPNQTLETGPLSIYTEKLLNHLIQIGHKRTTRRQFIFEAISSLIKYSKNDCLHLIQSMTEYAINKIELLLETIQTKNKEQNEFNMMQSNFTGVLLNCIYRLGKDIDPYCDKIMNLIFKVSSMYFSEQLILSSVVVEDTYLLISAMITSVGTEFMVYIEKLVPYFPLVLQSNSAVTADRLCLVGVGILSDLCCTLNEKICPHAESFMNMLLDVLRNQDADGDVKPATISCLGDVAHAIGPQFMPYVETVMMVLQQVGNMQTDKNDEEMTSYIDTIRSSSIDAFVGMLQGLSQDEITKQSFLIKAIDFLLFINSIAKDMTQSDRLNRAILGLLGDVARIYGSQIQINMVETLLNSLVTENVKGLRHFSKRTLEVASWAQKMVKEAYYE